MGKIVLADNETVWEPSMGVAMLFLGNVKLLEDLLGIESGVAENLADEISIDRSKLRIFIIEATQLFETSNNTPLIAMIESTLTILIGLSSHVGMDLPLPTGRSQLPVDRSKLVFGLPEEYLT